MAGFGVLFVTETRSEVWLGVLFALAGVYVAIEEALEPAMTADLVPDKAIRGTAMGVLATVNGLGDFIASVGVGALRPRPASGLRGRGGGDAGGSGVVGGTESEGVNPFPFSKRPLQFSLPPPA